MNMVEVIGGNRTQREICHNVVSHIISLLLPRYRTLDITVTLKTLHGDALGYCMMEENNRTFEIELHNKVSIKELVTNLCHEMVHQKQYARKEMNDGDVQSGSAVWKGRKVNPNTDYYNLPWEKEAYRMEKCLSNSVWVNDVI